MTPVARVAAALLITGLYLPIFAGTLYITVTDPSGALVAGAAVTVSAPQGGAEQNKKTELPGRATFDLPAAQYHVAITHAGFEPAERDAAVTRRTLDLTVNLKITAANTTMHVSGTRSPLAN